jgi:predicted nuclease of predicted toxin-antitoxin system
VKLLFDENVSHRLVAGLARTYPGSAHVRDIGLLGASDDAVWDHAREFDFVIVSKDNDFRQRSFVQGAPPKVVWLEVGNSGTNMIAELLRDSEAQIAAFERDEEASLLVLNRK